MALSTENDNKKTEIIYTITTIQIMLTTVIMIMVPILALPPIALLQLLPHPILITTTITTTITPPS